MESENFTKGSGRGRLRNGNAPGDPQSSPRCGASTRSGGPCQAPAMWSKRTQRYTRCRLHGGASTGPKTAEGRERSRKANLKDGRFTREAIKSRRDLRAWSKRIRAKFDALKKQGKAIIQHCREERRRERRRMKAKVARLRRLWLTPTGPDRQGWEAVSYERLAKIFLASERHE